MSEISFAEFIKNFGFQSYPFNIYTSENEREKGHDLFVSTAMYGPIIDAFTARQTTILSGDRGTGKTAIIYDLLRRTEPSSSLIVNFDDYSQLPLSGDSTDLYKFVIQKVCGELFTRIAKDRKTGRSLTKSERLMLSYYYARFTRPATRSQLSQEIQRLQQTSIGLVSGLIYRIIRFPLNIGANAAASFLSDIISRSLGSPHQDTKWNEYFPELAIDLDNDFADAESSYEALVRLIGLAQKLGFSRSLLLFDKVDEDPRLNNAAEDIADFITPIVTDNKFLLGQNFQVVLSVWVIPFNMLRDRIRTQKIYCPSVQWGSNDLISAFERRVSVYSSNRLSSFAATFSDDVSEEEKKNILTLCNHNPRDLWHIFDKLFQAQYRIDPSMTRIGSAAIKDGIDAFVAGFNFYEYYPRKSNARANSMDIYSYIKHLLKLKNMEFTKNQLNDMAGTGSSTQNYVSAMESIGLIERSGQSAGSVTFKIRDPKVRHALERGIDISRTT